MFEDEVSWLLAKNRVSIRHGCVEINWDQGIVERWNRTLVERLFGHQYAQELLMNPGEFSGKLVKRLSTVLAALNGEVTRLTGLEMP